MNGCCMTSADSPTHEASCRAYWPCGCAKAWRRDGSVRPHTHRYPGLRTERDDLRARGYVTPREAADSSGVSLNWAYRAMRRGDVPFVLGRNQVARYMHKATWEQHVRDKRVAEMARIGVMRGGDDDQIP